MIRIKLLLFIAFSIVSLAAAAQAGVPYDLKKPPKFENRVLASEKSGDGRKIKKVRRFIQNTVTHYNYYFNANEKLKTILARAKAQHRDDYTRLLPFYNFTLDATLSQRRELDSVIYKCTAGILIHDTRSDWVDNLYLLIGESFFYRKEFDSAYITFQFLNYAFAPKESDGYDIPIGSNANADNGGSADIVSTKEKRNIVQKALSQPPSRNASLVWKIRTYLAKDQLPEAGSLIEVLKKDPQFPARLQPELAEVQALLFYKQNNYDSAAFYLERALPSAFNKEEEARWEYLIAQLYENAGRPYEAKAFYDRTIRHTYNPVLEIYARLNSIRQNRDSSADFIQKNIDALVKMGKKDRYEEYRDIIWFTAAQMELERNDRPGAIAFLLLCTKASTGPAGIQRNKAFLQLGNMAFEDKKYRNAKNYYDSLTFFDPNGQLGDLTWLPDRKNALAVIVAQLQVLDRQDSLQRIAALPPDQRDAYIKKLVRTLRRQQGLREEESNDSTSNNNRLTNNNNSVPDLFSSGSGSSGDWYFNNSSLKSKGYNDFRTRWGNRANVDNWFLSSSAKQAQASRNNERTPGMPDIDGKAAATAAAPGAINFKTLLESLPLTPEKMKKVQDSTLRALFALGRSYQEGIEDYKSAVTTYETLLEKFPESSVREMTLVNLYKCYKKLGDETNAARIMAMMRKEYPASPLTAITANPDSAAKVAGADKINATRLYEKIYGEYIEGKFTQAEADKKAADSVYGDKYWTAQLLYIESVYHIHERHDAQAIAILGGIVGKFPNTPMAKKAATLIDVLKRRREIEDYLTKLEVKRATDDEPAPVLAPAGPSKVADRPLLARNDSNLLHKEDTSSLAKAHITPVAGGIKGPKPTPGIPGMDKLNVDTASMQKITMNAGQLAALQKQVDSLNAAAAKAQADSAAMVRLKKRTDSIQAAMARLRADSTQMAARVKSLSSVFTNTPDKPQAVLIVLDKVDPVYVTEAKNAYSRYNQENFYSLGLTIENKTLSDSLQLVVFNGLPNAAAALDYMQKARAVAPREVIPWLPAAKYSFLIISQDNLQTLLSNKDLPGYKRFLSAVYPDKFYR